MGFWSILFGRKASSEDLSKAEIIEAGVCPTCWSHEEYNKAFKEHKTNTPVDKLNKKAFILQFVQDRVTGIKLIKKGDHLECAKCHKRPKL